MIAIIMINLLVLDVVIFTLLYQLKKKVDLIKKNDFLLNMLGSDKHDDTL